jgi:hypothetical protein
MSKAQVGMRHGPHTFAEEALVSMSSSGKRFHAQEALCISDLYQMWMMTDVNATRTYHQAIG